MVSFFKFFSIISPIIIFFIIIIYSYILHLGLFPFLLFCFNLFLNYILKYHFFKPIMNDDYFNFIGFGRRPINARGCSLNPYNNDLATSYGMPSNHAQIFGFFIGFINKYFHQILPTFIINNKILYYLSIFIFSLIISFLLFSRFYYNCHTFQQIFIGFFIGIFISSYL